MIDFTEIYVYILYLSVIIISYSLIFQRSLPSINDLLLQPKLQLLQLINIISPNYRLILLIFYLFLNYLLKLFSKKKWNCKYNLTLSFLIYEYFFQLFK